jgi:hypothetical protein
MVVTAPKKTEIITTIGRAPRPISTHWCMNSFQYMRPLSGLVNMPFNINRYVPKWVKKFMGLVSILAIKNYFFLFFRRFHQVLF